MSAGRDHLAALARAPRPAGSAAEGNARAYCARVLRAAGFGVDEREFEYSTFVGRWGTPLFGAAIAMLMVAAANEGSAGHGRTALLILVLGAAILGACGAWLGRRGVLDIPFARARSTNLVATRGAPSLWLVAHLDSKSQPIPIGVRALAIIASLIMYGVAMGIGVAQLLVPMQSLVWLALATLGVLFALPVMASVVGSHSPGALDDASGVVTVLRAAELLPREVAIGVLLTSAEELGLAGARAWAREAERASAINIDGIDDTGALRVIYSGRAPRTLLARLGPEWPAPSRLPPGVLMDGVALADAGWEVVNVSKGSWRTVSRIHTLGDDLAQLDGSGAEAVAAMLARAIAGSPR